MRLQKYVLRGGALRSQIVWLDRSPQFYRRKRPERRTQTATLTQQIGHKLIVSRVGKRYIGASPLTELFRRASRPNDTPKCSEALRREKTDVFAQCDAPVFHPQVQWFSTFEPFPTIFVMTHFHRR